MTCTLVNGQNIPDNHTTATDRHEKLIPHTKVLTFITQPNSNTTAEPVLKS
jgi:hypothetical protein